jgi:hypothetical protein
LVGGGVRDLITLDEYLSLGVRRVILGTAAFRDQPRETVQQKILDLLASENVAVEDLVKDAVSRDQALDAFGAPPRCVRTNSTLTQFSPITFGRAKPALAWRAWVALGPPEVGPLGQAWDGPPGEVQTGSIGRAAGVEAAIANGG